MRLSRRFQVQTLGTYQVPPFVLAPLRGKGLEFQLDDLDKKPIRVQSVLNPCLFITASGHRFAHTG